MKVIKPNVFNLSREGLYVSLCFIIWLVIFRVLLPFGDEPDFSVRAQELIDGGYPFWTPYAIFDSIFKHITIFGSCELQPDPTSFLPSIAIDSCSEELDQVFTRVLITLIVMFPVILLINFQCLFIKIFNKFFKFSEPHLRLRLQSVACTMLVPGFIYYISLISHEQLTLSMSLLAFLVWDVPILVIALVIMIGSIDFGNSVVVAMFFILCNVFAFIYRRYSLRTVFIAQAFILSLAYFIGPKLLHLLSAFPFLSEKSNAIYEKITTGEAFEKYPLILRPLFTFMSAAYMTPSGIKLWPLYIIFSLAIIVVFFKLYNNRIIQRVGYFDRPRFSLDIVRASSAIFLMCLICFVIPDYSNAKYYMFICPFFLLLSLYVYNIKSIIKFLNISCLSGIVTLTIYYML